MFGRAVHQAVKENGDPQTGVTIHQVSGEYDEGRILAQKIIPLSPTDNIDDIETKVKTAEPDFYIETIRQILKKEILLD